MEYLQSRYIVDHISAHVPDICKLLFTVMLAPWIIACATKPPEYLAADNHSQISSINRVALVTDITPPAIENVFLGYTNEEAVDLNTKAFAASILLFILGSDQGPEFVSGYPEDIVAEAEAGAQRILDPAYLQTRVLEHVQSYGNENVELEFIRLPGDDVKALGGKPDYKALSEKSIDAVLEIELLRVAFRYSLVIEARARLVSTRTNTVLSDSPYVYKSERRNLEEWIRDDAAPLTLTIQQGMKSIAEYIVDENFLLFYPQETEVSNEPEKIISNQESESLQDGYEWSKMLDGGYPLKEILIPHYVLAPIYPELNYSFVSVDSVQPTLRWETFPKGDESHTDSGGQIHTISDVRYDLRVFDTVGSTTIPGHQIYNVRGLREPYHTIESKLEACQNYFWTVRARFKLDERPRTIEWAGKYGAGIPLYDYNNPWDMRHGHRGSTYNAYDGSVVSLYFPFSVPCDINIKDRAREIR